MTSPKSLEEAKSLVESEYLGVGGIHAVGKKTTKNAVRIYARASSTELGSIMEKIKERCLPFAVDLVIEESPSSHLPSNR